MNRIPGISGFQKRMRFTFLARARTMSSRQDSFPARKRSRTVVPTCAVGLIFAGAGARLVTADGSIKLRINQRPNHPGVTCSTGESGFPLTATDMGGRYASFVMHRCSRHWPTLQEPARRLPVELFLGEFSDQLPGGLVVGVQVRRKADGPSRRVPFLW